MKTLYFVKGCVPTAEQKAEAASMGALIRNANITSCDFVERCDAVAGDVPEAYAKFPRGVPGKIVDDPDAGKGEGVQAEVVAEQKAEAVQAKKAKSSKADAE